MYNIYSKGIYRSTTWPTGVVRREILGRTDGVSKSVFPQEEMDPRVQVRFMNVRITHIIPQGRYTCIVYLRSCCIYYIIICTHIKETYSISSAILNTSFETIVLIFHTLPVYTRCVCAQVDFKQSLVGPFLEKTVAQHVSRKHLY